MTKKAVENILKRFTHISKAIKNGQPNSVFYKGNRKGVVVIDDDVKNVCELIELVYEHETVPTIKRIIYGLKNEESDIHLMALTHYSKNAYYAKKSAIVEKIFKLCIYRKMVSVEEILNERIA